jgi:YihY family inner membrane protein
MSQDRTDSDQTDGGRTEKDRAAKDTGKDTGGTVAGLKAAATEKAEAADRYQKEHPAVGIPVAVFRKFSEDRSTNLASMIAFWAFFSLFPLLLVFVTLLGYFVPADIKAKVLGNVSSMLPLLNTSATQSLHGAWWALVLGLATALWSGMAVVRNTELAFNAVWEIPYTKQPKLVSQIVRAVSVLATIGLGLVLSTLISGFVSGTATGINLGWAGRVLGYVISLALDVGLFVALFRILTNRDVTTRDVLPGATLSGVLFFVLQALSSLIISRYLQNAQGTYGQFATVITILWWFYLQSIITLLGAQLNVVLKRRLHPRGVVDPPDTEADERAYESYARERTYVDEERVHADFPGRSGRD